MTEKMKTFCLEYLLDDNGTQSAIRAGYSKRSAASIAEENLRKPEILAYIEKLKKEIVSDKEKIILDNIIYWRSVIKDEKKKDADKLKASELLGKYAAMFTENLNLSGDLSVTIIDDIRDKNDKT
jgi:phage terminase small subunit